MGQKSGNDKGLCRMGGQRKNLTSTTTHIPFIRPPKNIFVQQNFDVKHIFFNIII